MAKQDFIIETRLLKKKIKQLKFVVDTLTKVKPPQWEIVSALSEIHGVLGEGLYLNYSEHTGFSGSPKLGTVKHGKASQRLLDELEKRMTRFGEVKHKEWNQRLDIFMRDNSFISFCVSLYCE